VFVTSKVCAAGLAPPWVAVKAMLVRDTASAGCCGGVPEHVTGLAMSVWSSAWLSARS
jgi:hypothetical protein